MTTRRLYYALFCFALLGVAAEVTLTGNFRLAVWVLLGGLAFKSWLAWVELRRREEESEKTVDSGICGGGSAAGGGGSAGDVR